MFVRLHLLSLLLSSFNTSSTEEWTNKNQYFPKKKEFAIHPNWNANKTKQTQHSTKRTIVGERVVLLGVVDVNHRSRGRRFVCVCVCMCVRIKNKQKIQFRAQISAVVTLLSDYLATLACDLSANCRYQILFVEHSQQTTDCFTDYPIVNLTSFWSNTFG